MTEEKETKALQDFFCHLEKELEKVRVEKDWAVTETEKHCKVLEKLKGRVECPVCLVVPRGAPSMCPRVRWLQGEEEAGGTDRLPHLRGGHQGGNQLPACRRGDREYGP